MHLSYVSRPDARRLILIATWAVTAFGQTTIDLARQARNVDFSGAPFTRPSKTGTTLPSTCNAGETFFLTSATAGSNWYGCATANSWSLQGSGVPYSGATHDIDLGTYSLHAGLVSAGDGTASSVVILPELTTNGTNDTRIYGADVQASAGCIIWPVGASTTGQVAADNGTTATTTDGKICRVFAWQTPSSGSSGTESRGTGAGSAYPSSLYSDMLSMSSGAGSAAQLKTWSLPANTLAVDGASVEIIAYVREVAAGSSTFVQFGSTRINPATIASTIANQPVKLDCTVMRRTSTSQMAYCTAWDGSLATELHVVSASEDLTASVPIYLYAVNGNLSAGDVVADGWTITSVSAQ